MTANRSLDEFAAASGDGEAEPADEPTAASSGDEPAVEPTDVETPTDDPVQAADADDATVEPVASTYQWTPGGGPCAVCGDAAEERWRQGDDLVCPACKEW